MNILIAIKDCLAGSGCSDAAYARHQVDNNIGAKQQLPPPEPSGDDDIIATSWTLCAQPRNAAHCFSTA